MSAASLSSLLVSSSAPAGGAAAGKRVNAELDAQIYEVTAQVEQAVRSLEIGTASRESSLKDLAAARHGLSAKVIASATDENSGAKYRAALALIRATAALKPVPLHSSDL
jgi:hypothetical protein